jgi:hypothetical protein
VQVDRTRETQLLRPTDTELAGLDADGYEQWRLDYYRSLLLPVAVRAPRP